MQAQHALAFRHRGHGGGGEDEGGDAEEMGDGTGALTINGVSRACAAESVAALRTGMIARAVVIGTQLRRPIRLDVSEEGRTHALAVRPEEVDPRIHFALNCGARSCPPIRVYSAAFLEEGLATAAGAFCEGEVEVDEATGAVTLSKIFQWYGRDFAPDERGRLFAIAKFLPAARAEALRRAARREGGARVRFREYDWTSQIRFVDTVADGPLLRCEVQRRAPAAVQLHHIHTLDEQRHQAVEIVALDGPVHRVGRAAQQRAQQCSRFGTLVSTRALAVMLRLGCTWTCLQPAGLLPCMDAIHDEESRYCVAEPPIGWSRRPAALAAPTVASR